MQYFAVLKNKIPYVFIAITLISGIQLHQEKIKIVMQYFMLCMVASCMWTFYQITDQQINVLAEISKGGSVPTLIHHIAFSLLLVFALLFSIYLHKNSNNKIEKGIYISCGIFFFLVNHLMIARSGLLLTYSSLFIIFVYETLEKKQYIKLGITLVLLGVLLGINLKENPYLKNKIDYTLATKYVYENNLDTLNQYSDSRRILSLKLGKELFENNKILGTGIGDVQLEMKKLYATKYPKFEKDVQSKIHNQYLFIYVACGILLGSICCLAFLFILYYFLKTKNILFFILTLNIHIIGLWEAFLENQLGTSLLLLTILLGYLINKEEQKIKQVVC